MNPMDQTPTPASPAPPENEFPPRERKRRPRLGPLDDVEWKKLSCEVPAQTKESLAACRRLLAVNSNSEVIRKSVQLLELVLREIKDGHRIFLVKGVQKSELRFL